ncbi:MAG: preprotein translocase subunit SecA [Candidatus Peribacteraceae bacterium]
MSAIDVLNTILGDPNRKELKKLWPTVRRVRERCAQEDIRSLTVEQLPVRTQELRDKIAEGMTPDDILPDAFATVIRACELIMGKKSTLGKQEFTWDMVPYDVQILGGIALHSGCIAEMKTGEGKTLVCTMPVYLNALSGKGVHVVTVNDYLAKRDALWMGMLYEALGLSFGTILHELNHEERRQAYACDITYGTNNEFGFDYLRDNMAGSIERQVQRELHYAIVDEVDSILIDEARTPLIISQPGEESTQKYLQYAQIVHQLQENVHYNKDEKQRLAALTEEGIHKMEEILGVENVYTDRGFEEVHHIEQALRAHAIYQRDVDYVVKDGEIIIVDEFTGRLMPGRRYGHGLHQAIEAKERVEVQRESKTLATITFQNYFRLYHKLAGMTGTAKTEEEEFESIYKLRTIVIPTHKPLVRDDKPDAIYRTVKSKFKAVAETAMQKHDKGQPVLIGTTSIEKSEAMSALLQNMKVPHQVLNAKQHQKEAEIVANAGQKGAVTIATNMAGRGTDIKLGEGVAELGGLCILGTERHEARRIDNQLRGRAGRQGDPGESRFFVSMEDELMRLFGGDRLKNMMERLNVPEDQPLENRIVSRSIESAQKRVEGRNFDIRKHVVQYDDVMNKHREIMYTRRKKILERIAVTEENSQNTEEKPLHQDILEAMRREIAALVQAHAGNDDPEQWNAAEIAETMAALHPSFADTVTTERIRTFQESEKVQEFLEELVVTFYEEKCKNQESSIVQRAEHIVTLRSIDMHWMNHIDDMAHLREQVAFSGFAQRDPLIEYKDQGFRRFRQLLVSIDSSIVRMLLQADFEQFAAQIFMRNAQNALENAQTNEDQISAELTETGAGSHLENTGENPIVVKTGASKAMSTPQQTQQVSKIGRNDMCPCGSGKKYKKCCGK